MRNDTLDEVHWGQNIPIEAENKNAHNVKNQMTFIVTYLIDFDSALSNVDSTLNDKDRTNIYKYGLMRLLAPTRSIKMKVKRTQKMQMFYDVKKQKHKF